MAPICRCKTRSSAAFVFAYTGRYATQVFPIEPLFPGLPISLISSVYLYRECSYITCEFAYFYCSNCSKLKANYRT